MNASRCRRGVWRVVDLHHPVQLLVTLYAAVNASLEQRAWDPYPFILLNLFLSMLAAFQAPSS